MMIHAYIYNVDRSISIYLVSRRRARMCEDESFPLASRVHPELTRKGAWDDFEQYTFQDLYLYLH